MRAGAVLALTLLSFGPARAQVLADLVDRTVPASRTSMIAAGKNAVFGLVSAHLATPFTGVAVDARTASALFSAEIRFLDEAGSGPWMPMHVVRSATGESLVAGFRSETVRSEVRFEVRATVPEGFEVAFGTAGTFDNRLDADRLPRPDGLEPLPAVFAGSVVPPPLVTRTEWGADPFIGTPSPLASPGYEFMTFHHAAGFSAETLEEGIAQMKAIQDLHQDIRGWSDVGYQFVIDRGGRLYQGRPFLTEATTLEELPVLALGAHVGGANTGNIGVSLLGCYHPSEGSYCEQVITQAAYDTYVRLFAFLAERYGVPTDRIRGHRDFSVTACPGDNNYVLLPRIAADMLDLLEFGDGDPVRPTDFVLSAPYPNPADGEIRFRYALREAGFVTVELYDTVGRRVREIASGYQDPDTWHTAVVDVAALSAGVYFYRIRVEGFAGISFDETRSVAVVR